MEATVIKNIFIPLPGFARDVRALVMGLRVAKLFGAHLDCLHVRPDPRLLVVNAAAGMETGLGMGVVPAELLNTLIEADNKRAKTARTTFDAFRRSHDIATD